jgi:hypothetical protein
MSIGQARSHSPQPTQRLARWKARTAWNIQFSSAVEAFDSQRGAAVSTKQVRQ